MHLLQKLIAATTTCLLVALASPASGQDLPAPEETARFRFGPIRFTPVLTISNLGMDSNVFNEADDPKSDNTAVFGPLADYWVKLGRARLIGQTRMDYFYFREYDTQRSFGTTNRLRLEVPLAHLVPFVAGEYTEHQAADRGMRSTHVRAGHSSAAARAWMCCSAAARASGQWLARTRIDSRRATRSLA